VRNQGYVVLERYLWENIGVFCIFEILYFFCIFELIENMCHTTRAVERTLKEKENYFSIFSNHLEESVTRRKRPDRHNKNEREPLFYFSIF